MRWVLNKHLAFVVLVAFVCYVLPIRVPEAKALEPGKRTADDAASWQTDAPAGGDKRGPLRFGASSGHSFADADTTEFEFPEEKKTHLVRDIAIFVIVAAFVGYFLIKVFLEGDTDEGEEEEGGGKEIPPL